MYLAGNSLARLLVDAHVLLRLLGERDGFRVVVDKDESCIECLLLRLKTSVLLLIWPSGAYPYLVI